MISTLIALVNRIFIHDAEVVRLRKSNGAQREWDGGVDLCPKRTGV